MVVRACRGLLLLALYHAPAGAAAAERFDAERVVAFGDVHGAYGALVDLLGELGIVDAELAWQGGTTHLVSLGDLPDRGPDTRAVMDLLRRLMDEAEAAGGRVHVVLGNHELMNLTGDFRYVSDGERAAFADLAPGAGADPGADPPGLAGVRAAYAPDGPYGAWLLERPAAVIINDTAFVHGGLAPLVADLGPDGLNGAIRSALVELLDLQRQLEERQVLTPGMEVNDAAEALASRLEGSAEVTDPAEAPPAALEPVPEPYRALARDFIERTREPLFGEAGPFWYRGNARCPVLLEAPGLDRVLKAWGVRRVVVGHTPTVDHRVRTRLDGRVIMADTGMLASHYGGVASALIFEHGDVSVRYAGTAAATAAERSDDAPLSPLLEERVLEALARIEAPAASEADWQPVDLPGAGSAVIRSFQRSRREAAAELAAWRLDRLLGFNLVLPLLPSPDGVLVAAWPNVVDETVRAEHRAAPAWCAGGNAYELMYALDALIGNAGRSQQSMVYDPRTWRLGSVAHADSFGRSRRLPAYLEQVQVRLPAALVQRLRALDRETLEEAIGEWIGSAQIRALLARRDAMLERWAGEG